MSNKPKFSQVNCSLVELKRVVVCRDVASKSWEVWAHYWSEELQRYIFAIVQANSEATALELGGKMPPHELPRNAYLSW